MLNGFCDYIARTIASYFQERAEGISKGSRYCLRLDTPELVKQTYETLQTLLAQKNVKGYFNFKGVYETFTLRLMDGKELVIAAKQPDITDDFFTALRNNALTENRFPILIITYSPIDSVVSGTADMSAFGMPFHAESLAQNISEDINKAHLTAYEQNLLQAELDKRCSDRFSEKSSVYVYSDLLSVIEKGEIDAEACSVFHVFPDKQANRYPNQEIANKIQDNAKLFDKIDQIIKFGNTSHLEKDFNQDFIEQIERKIKKGEPWYKDYSYQDILSYKKRKEATFIKLSEDNISVFQDIEINALVSNEDFFVKKDGTTAARSRKLNVLIFNKERHENLTVSIDLGSYVRLKKDEVKTTETVQSWNQNAQKITFQIRCEGCTFASIELKDPRINSQIKVAIINAPRFYFDAIRTSYRLDIKTRRSKIELLGFDKGVCFNQGAQCIETKELQKDGCYPLTLDRGINLIIEDARNTTDTGDLGFSLKLGEFEIPFELIDDIHKVPPLTGTTAFLLKHEKHHSLEYRNNIVILGAEEYRPTSGDEGFAGYLQKENYFIKNKVLACKDVDGLLIDVPLELPDSVRNAYLCFLSELENQMTLPSLAYYDGSLKEAASTYIKAVTDFVETIEAGSTLTKEQNNILLLGSIFRSDSADGFLLSPLHPLNVAYQLALLDEHNIEHLKDYMVGKLSAMNLLPYLKESDGTLCQPHYVKSSPGWVNYFPTSTRQYFGSKSFVADLVKDKIYQYLDHFEFLFEQVANRTVRINLINMGDCSDVLLGLTAFVRKELESKKKAIEDVLSFEIHIYSNDLRAKNKFDLLGNAKSLHDYVSDNVNDVALSNDVYSVLSSHIHCYYHKQSESKYEYAHLCFYEMPNSEKIGLSRMDSINTGVSLGGITSGVPSVLNTSWHKTGFGTKYAKDTALMGLAKRFNSINGVAFSGNSYEPDSATFTEISQEKNTLLEKIYQSANWIVFVSPKVDLSYFHKSDDSLMIIHYSDQYSSASGYDDITVTNRSLQYKEIIKEQLHKKGIDHIEQSQVNGIVKFFNAINGDWLLRLISTKKPKGFQDNNFSREKMSILSAMKLLMATLPSDGVLWVPLSLEELLRVSGGAGYSQKEGLLSARNLGFPEGPKCDDLLMVGFDFAEPRIRVYLHPVEVKIGENTSVVIDKAQKQVLATYKGLKSSLIVADEENSFEQKLSRNFFMQHILTCCEKFKLYGFYSDNDWDGVLDTHREPLLNDEYDFVTDFQCLGKASVISFKSNAETVSVKRLEGVNLLELPERFGADILCQEDAQIYSLVQTHAVLTKLTNDYEVIDSEPSPDIETDTETEVDPIHVIEDFTGEGGEDAKHGQTLPNLGEVGQGLDQHQADPIEVKDFNEGATTAETEAQNLELAEPTTMKILLGADTVSGEPFIWRPNDTEMVFHTNTGIIGTMGTGKTQFTKSLVAQMIAEQKHNFESDPLSVLIFDYKGDYNERHADFVEETSAKVLKPYHLPFNPFALNPDATNKPLLPLHVANAFVTTLSKIYGLGPKQENALKSCIKNAYQLKGISVSEPSTWSLTPPTFSTVYEVYEQDEEIKKTDSLAAAMVKLQDFQIFESDARKTQSLFEVLDGVVVIDLAGYDTDIQNLIVAITLDLFYSQMLSKGSSKMNKSYRQLTKMILVDEADNFMSQGFPSLKKIMKEGREFGVGVILSTQFLKHFGAAEDDYSKYVLTWVVHNVADMKTSDIDFVFKTEAKSVESTRLFNDVKALNKHYSIVKISNNSPRYIKDYAFWEYRRDRQAQKDI